jgi:hypothetical protein
MDYIIAVTQDSMERLRDMLLEEFARPGTKRDVLWGVLCESASASRARGQQAEQFVVQVKEAWEAAALAHTGVSTSASDAAQQRLKQDVVTRAIKAYYMQ